MDRGDRGTGRGELIGVKEHSKIHTGEFKVLLFTSNAPAGGHVRDICLGLVLLHLSLCYFRTHVCIHTFTFTSLAWPLPIVKSTLSPLT